MSMDESRQNLINDNDDNENDLIETMKIKTPEMNIQLVNHIKIPPSVIKSYIYIATHKSILQPHKERNEDNLFLKVSKK